jgi:myo-inositol 2-dehydrogenase / D-chiro-inositol 1-dehydrogenase
LFNITEVYQGGKDMTVKLGFIGTGGIANAHLRNISNIDEATVTAFYDIQLERAEDAAQKWDNARAYSDLEQMLDDAQLDAVFICVPPMAHGAAEEAVIARGLPFLVEKPLAISRELPRTLLQKIEQKNIITSVGFHWRYSEASQKAKQIVSEQKAGMALGYWLGGMPMVPWWRRQDGSGGQFVEQTTHITDLLRFICGEVTEVYAAYGHRVMEEKVEGTTVADVGTVTMKLENGSVATISNTCLLPVGHHVGLDVYTDHGVLEIRGGSLKQIEPGKTTQWKNRANPYHTEDEVFIEAVRTGDDSNILSPYREAIKTHEVTVAANESAKSGKPISLTGAVTKEDALS